MFKFNLKVSNSCLGLRHANPFKYKETPAFGKFRLLITKIPKKGAPSM